MTFAPMLVGRNDCELPQRKGRVVEDHPLLRNGLSGTVRSHRCIRRRILDKKMVDGKGGNLKTIHHYKTERIFLTTPPFRLLFHLCQPSAELGRYTYRRQHQSEKKRTVFLFRSHFFFSLTGRSASDVSDSLPRPGLQKNHTPEFGRD